MPLIVSPSLVTNTPADELADRLKRPHIGWHNVLPHQLVQCPAALKDPLTWNRWRGIPNFPNLLQIDRNSVAASGAINYVGIASHNLGTIGREVQIRHFSEEKLGPELVTNGDFDSGLTGWELVSGNASVSGGVLTLVNAGANGRVRQTVPVDAGKTYRFTATGVTAAGDNNGFAQFTGGPSVATFPAGSSGATISAIFTATANTEFHLIAAGLTGGFTLSLDSVSIREQLRPAGWFTLARFTPTTDDAIMVIFEDETTPAPGNFDQWEVSIAASTTPPEIGAMAMGRVLVMPHCIYGGHSPATLSRETEIEPNVSIGGRFLGRSIIRRGYRTDYEFRHLPAQWYREHFDPFVEHALREPFFISWKPDKFPAEVLYGWTTDDLRPVNMGIRDLMSVSFGVEGWR